MIQPSYENNEHIKRIREQYGHQRATFEGVTETPGALQDELRPGESESGESSGDTPEASYGVARGKERISRSERAAKRSDSRERRASTASHESGSGVDRGHQPDNRTVSGSSIRDKIAALYAEDNGISAYRVSQVLGCSHVTAAKYLKQMRSGESEEPTDKPTGLAPKPHPKEQQARQQQQASIEPKKGSLLSLLKPGSKNKKSSEEKAPLRTKPLSAQEAEAMRGPLLAALLDYFKYADEFIYATNKAHKQVSIWSSIDEEDAGVLVDVWLSRARQSAKSASHVVYVVGKHEQLRVGIILLPRFYETFRVYMENGVGIR